jgi:hypothetical protein
MKGDFSRLKGDLSRHTFERLKHYAGVLHQQGRVWLDSDWNDEVVLQLNLLRQETFDIVGRCGAPAPGTAFTISPPLPGNPLDAFQISGGPGPEGRYYVDGILCQLDRTVNYLTQPDFPNPPRLTISPREGLTALVYIEVWQRLITYLEDEEIREVALSGPDTATRVKTIAQVKVTPLTTDRTITCEEALATVPISGGTLTTLQPTDTMPPDPCRLPDPASYTGRENHLYRVEIHDGGDVSGASQGFVFNVRLANDANVGAVNLALVSALTPAEADALRRSGFVIVATDDGQLERAPLSSISQDGRTITLGRGLLNSFTTVRSATVTGGVARFKWSRDNAAFGVRVTAISPDRRMLTLANLGRDQTTALREGDLVEIVDDTSELGPARGHLANLTADPNPDTFTATIADGLPPGFGIGATPAVTSPPLLSPPAPDGVAGHLLLRRWDGQGLAQAVFNETTTPQLNLGDGVHIQFGGSNLQSGDYWQFTARSIDGSIEVLDNAPPMGIARHRCALALVRWGLRTVFNLEILAGILANFPAVVAELQKTGLKEFDEAAIVQAAERVGLSAAAIDSLRQLLKAAADRGTSSVGMTVLEDCRKPFQPLTDVPGPEPGIHVTQVLLGAAAPLLNDTDVQIDALMEGINVLCDANVDPASITRPTCFVSMEFPFQFATGAPGSAYQQLVLGAAVSVAGNTISWQPDGRVRGLLTQAVAIIPQGDRGILLRLTLKGNFIWDRDNPDRFLDGEAFGIRPPGAPNTNLRLPSGDKRRSGDFEMWFWLARPLALASLVVNPASVIAGSLSQGTVTLTGAASAGGAVVALSSSAPNRATVPATVTIPAGSASTTFPIQTIPAQAGPVTITAAFSGVNMTAQLNLVRLISLIVNPTQVAPGTPSTGSLTFSSPVPDDAVVNLISSNTALVKVPSTVTIPAGSTTFNFNVQTISVSGEINVTVNISASLAGVTVAAPLIVIRIG